MRTSTRTTLLKYNAMYIQSAYMYIIVAEPDCTCSNIIPWSVAVLHALCMAIVCENTKYVSRGGYESHRTVC